MKRGNSQPPTLKEADPDIALVGGPDDPSGKQSEG